MYVKELYVNGKKYDKSYLKYEDIRDGVKLRFVMSSKPNYKRAVSDEAVAPSFVVAWKDNEISGKFDENGYIKPVKITFEGVLPSPFDSTK